MKDETPSADDKLPALVMPTGDKLAELYSMPEKVESLLAGFEREVRSYVLDVSTKAGREAISSLAYRVSRSKTALDEGGKALTEEARKQIETVNAVRNTIKSRLDALRDETKAPLVAWEAAEDQRIRDHQARLALIFGRDRAPGQPASEAVEQILSEIEGVKMGAEEWDEFADEADLRRDAALTHYRAVLEAARKREAETRELEELRAAKAKADAEQTEREQAEQVARQQAEAEARRKTEVADLTRALIEAQGALDSGYEATPIHQQLAGPMQARIAALESGDPALSALFASVARNAETLADAETESAKVAAEAEAKAAAEARAAAEKAMREKAAAEAVEAERQRAARERAEEQARQEREAAARAADNKRQATILKDITAALTGLGDDLTPDLIAAAIFDGKIPHVTVNL